jgi:hypothetical protein
MYGTMRITCNRRTTLLTLCNDRLRVQTVQGRQAQTSDKLSNYGRARLDALACPQVHVIQQLL